MPIRAKDIMTGPAVVIHEDGTLEEAAILMLDKGVGGLPVVSGDGRLAGIVTESDFAAKEPGIPFSRMYAPRLFGEWMPRPELEKAYEAARSIMVKQIMSKPVVTASEDELLADVVMKMLERRIHRVPVVRDGVPVGVVSRRDLLKLAAGRLEVLEDK